MTGLAAAVDRALAAGLDLRALEAVAQDDIDHTGKGFRSLCDHGAVTRYLDPLDGRQRNRVQVVVRLGDAPPIDEDRRAVSADGPQPDDLQAERPVKTEGIKVVAAFEEIPEVAHARQFDVGPVDHDDRVQIRCHLPRNKAGGGGKSIPPPRSRHRNRQDGGGEYRETVPPVHSCGHAASLSSLKVRNQFEKRSLKDTKRA